MFPDLQDYYAGVCARPEQLFGDDEMIIGEKSLNVFQMALRFGWAVCPSLWSGFNEFIQYFDGMQHEDLLKLNGDSIAILKEMMLSTSQAHPMWVITGAECARSILYRRARGVGLPYNNMLNEAFQAYYNLEERFKSTITQHEVLDITAAINEYYKQYLDEFQRMVYGRYAHTKWSVCFNETCCMVEVMGQDKFQRCSMCKCVVYCSKICQSEHWKNGHKLTCVASK